MSLDFEEFSSRFNRGLRLKDAEYSSRYVEILRDWMKATGNWGFEERLIEEGLISLEIKNAQLGLDFILDSLSPREEMAFENGVIRYVPLDPEKQIPRRYRNELIRQRKEEAWFRDLALSTEDLRDVAQTRRHSTGYSLSGSITYSERVFRIPEPPYAEACRNAPPDLRISWLRWLRESGEFEESESDVQIAALLISKGHTRKEQITNFFSHVISWERFIVAQGRVNRVLQRSWPELFRRMELVKAKLTEKQLEAFENRYDVDLRPTQKEAARRLGIDVSSLKERLFVFKRKLTEEFREFSHLKRSKVASSRHSDLLFGGLYRKSMAYFRKGIRLSACGERSPVLASVYRISVQPKANADARRVRAWLRLRHYSPGLKTVLAGSSRGSYRVEKGEFFHHPEIWKRTRLLGRIDDS